MMKKKYFWGLIVILSMSIGCAQQSFEDEICDCANNMGAGNFTPIPNHNLYIPNVITLNYDGINDRFQIVNLEYYPDSYIEIFRHNNLIYADSGSTFYWPDTLQTYVEGKYRYELSANGGIQMGYVCIYFNEGHINDSTCLKALLGLDVGDPLLSF